MSSQADTPGAYEVATCRPTITTSCPATIAASSFARRFRTQLEAKVLARMFRGATCSAGVALMLFVHVQRAQEKEVVRSVLGGTASNDALLPSRSRPGRPPLTPRVSGIPSSAPAGDANSGMATSDGRKGGKGVSLDIDTSEPVPRTAPTPSPLPSASSRGGKGSASSKSKSSRKGGSKQVSDWLDHAGRAR